MDLSKHAKIALGILRVLKFSGYVEMVLTYQIGFKIRRSIHRAKALKGPILAQTPSSATWLIAIVLNMH